jgi:hypothetical protein
VTDVSHYERVERDVWRAIHIARRVSRVPAYAPDADSVSSQGSSNVGLAASGQELEMTRPLEQSFGAAPAEAGADSPRLLAAKLGAFCWLVLIPVCCGAVATDVQAADITGAWASDASNCNKIFVKRGNGVFLAEEADLYGSGFVVEGRKIKGKMANCDIKTVKEEGSTVHLIAACATDIMLSNVQISLKVVDQNRIVRLFPGASAIEIPFERCTLQ